jgi:GNAT superfamily N-acetyltransferase
MKFSNMKLNFEEGEEEQNEMTSAVEFNEFSVPEKKWDLFYDTEWRYEWLSSDCVVREIKLYIHGICRGHFRVIGHRLDVDITKIRNPLPNKMEIYIDQPYRKMGFSKTLIGELLNKTKHMEPNVNTLQRFYVETDITNGFWDYIGMTHVSQTPTAEEYGFEKYITIDDLNNYVYA